jgi:hypothetical protein
MSKAKTGQSQQDIFDSMKKHRKYSDASAGSKNGRVGNENLEVNDGPGLDIRLHQMTQGMSKKKNLNIQGLGKNPRKKSDAYSVDDLASPKCKNLTFF